MSRTNDAIDDGWLCDRGRWEFEFVNSPQRLRTPLVRRDGLLVKATWDEALDLIATRFKAIIASDGPQAIGGIGSPPPTHPESPPFHKLPSPPIRSPPPLPP